MSQTTKALFQIKSIKMLGIEHAVSSSLQQLRVTEISAFKWLRLLVTIGTTICMLTAAPLAANARDANVDIASRRRICFNAHYCYRRRLVLDLTWRENDSCQCLHDFGNCNSRYKPTHGPFSKFSETAGDLGLRFTHSGIPCSGDIEQCPWRGQ